MRNEFYQLKVKRLISLIISMPILILLLPLFLIISIFIKIDSKGPILYKQNRIGYKNEIFRIYKFRTMINNAENIGPKLRTSENDFRVTRIGKLLRSTSLDETPQIFNVISGDMRLVGPRPTVPQIIDKLGTNGRKRHEVFPGITGWAQVNGRQSLTWKEKVEYDNEYVDKISFKLDILIIFLTFLKVVKKDSVSKKQISQEFDNL